MTAPEPATEPATSSPFGAYLVVLYDPFRGDPEKNTKEPDAVV